MTKKKQNGITLIALVITIIVLLILAGVSIMTLAGDNGLLNRTTSAKEKTEQAGVMENIKLAYQNALIGRYANNEDNQAIARQIESDLKGIYGQDSGVTVTEENGVYTVTTPDGRYTIDASGSVSRLEGLTISQTSLNLQKREGETPTATAITATKYGIEGTVSWSISPAGVATISPETGDEIYVTPAAGGSATLTATCGGKTKECTVTVTEVNKVAVTFNLGGGSVNNSTDAIVKNEFPGETIDIPQPTAPSATQTYTLKGWYDAASEGNLVYAANVTTTTVPNSATTVYAQWEEPKVAFRNYGTPISNSTYGTIGSTYSLTSGSETIKLDVKNTPNNTADDVEIADNWKIFYEDKDFLYLIYGDYYPAAAQTEITTENAIFAPAHTSSSSYQTESTKAYSVNSGASRTTLLGYLRNHSGYSWNTTSPYGDNYGSGTTYESWNDLKNAISGLSSMSGKTISVQGSPDIDLWVNSWNAKYGSGTNSAKLKVTKESNGYNIMEDKDTVTSNSNYYINVTQSPYNGANNDTNETGYYDELYFPYITEQTTANGYWLASPGADGDSTMCGVGYGGRVYCLSSYSNYYCSARPVVSIAK